MPDDTAHWRTDATPHGPRGDPGGGANQPGAASLAQTRQVVLHGCGLLAEGTTAAAWDGAARWAVLATGFGVGLNFLATWHAWRQAPGRPRLLFYTAITALPPEPQALIDSAAPCAELAPLATELAEQWHGLLPGVHRLRLEGGQVQLTLAVGAVQPMLAELSGVHDSVFFDADTPHNPETWQPHTLRAVARLVRPGARAAAGACVPVEAHERLTACGFVVDSLPATPPALRARYAPRWTPRPRRDADAAPLAAAPARCAVVGAGLAGAAVARALALRGWQVTVLDRAAEPAAGASGLPAGVVAPHVSPDDRPLSRLTRAGARATLTTARALLHEGVDFGVTGVLERHAPGERRLPPAWSDAMNSEASDPEISMTNVPITLKKAAEAAVMLNDNQRALWHARAGWLRPAALVRALLQTPGVTWRGNATVAHMACHGTVWHLAEASGTVLAEAELVVITAGFDSLGLLHTAASTAPPLHALRGQVAYGTMPGDATDAALPPFPVNGHGSLIAHLPGDDGAWWITGSTFERGNARPELLAADHAANHQRLAELLPLAGAVLGPSWETPATRAWAAVRATLPDRLPAVGAWPFAGSHESQQKAAGSGHESASSASISGANEARLPIQVLTGLGARGLTLAVLCGDLLAAWLHGDPSPVERSLARRLLAARWTERGATQP